MKYSVLISLVLMLGACGTFSGNFDEDPVLDKNDQPLVNKFTGKAQKLRSRRTQAAIASEHGKDVLVKMADTESKELDLAIEKERTKQAQVVLVAATPCLGVDGVDPATLTATGQASYYRTAENCDNNTINTKRDSIMLAMLDTLTDIVDKLSTKKSEIVLVAEQLSDTVKSLGREGTLKVEAIAKNVKDLGTTGFITNAADKVFRSATNALRDVGTEAAKTGNTTVNGLTVNAGATGSTSNDVASGDLGSGTADGDVNIDNNPDINLNIGGGTIVTGEDDAINFVNTDRTQNAEESATQNQGNDRQNGVNTSDGEIVRPINRDDDGGGDNSLF